MGDFEELLAVLRELESMTDGVCDEMSWWDMEVHAKAAWALSLAEGIASEDLR